MTSDARPSGRELPTHFDPPAVEGPTYRRWVDAGYFTADPTSGKPPYCIVIPPPNVTGELHLGHALGHTIKDALTRRRRMQGYEVLWLPGMDHASIATQNVVEREIGKEGLSRYDLGRERFVERVWQWTEEYGGKILGQMRQLGDGVDWTRQRFTMDDGLSRAVLTIFKRLYDDGLIYRAERIINWCPRCHTALSDIEVNHWEEDGELVSIAYGPLTVATTRVETMLGDTAVAVHPDDDRYRHLIGIEVELPLTGRKIPVVGDAHVDPEFGTGAVKVTPAHDPNDFEIGQRHDLPAVTVMDERGVITVPGPFQGLDRFEARPAVLAALREQGLVVQERRPYLHAVGHCERCDTVVEPRLSLQWFVRVAPLAEAAGDAVRDGRVTIHPPELARRYFDWVDHMHDWCISRQLWWGHRIPVWYGPNGEVRVVGPGDEPPPGAGWRQDDDVLDTWFSSALWPFSTLGWPEDTVDLRTFYPTDVLVTGYDILFFWVVRMMMFGLYAMDDIVPFRTVAMHGMVRDQYGKKMSKSRGNTVDPLDWLTAYGADALRFALARGANPGVDVPIGEDWVRASRNFVTKVWNAGRYALLAGATVGPLPPRERLSGPERWILSRLAGTLADVDRLYEQFQFAKICDTLFHFAWDEVFDWYVELAKGPIATGGDAATATRAVLGHVMDQLLRMLHPVMPFVTEELWRALTGGETLVSTAWPQVDPSADDPGAEAEIRTVQAVVTEIRRFRAEQAVPAGRRLPATLHLDAALTSYAADVGRLAGLTLTAIAPVGAVDVDLPGGGVTVDLSAGVDAVAERARLRRDLEAARAELAAVEAKLANPAFVEKAPRAVVEKVRGRQAAAIGELSRLDGLLSGLPSA